jgi:hypothetical protein
MAKKVYRYTPMKSNKGSNANLRNKPTTKPAAKNMSALDKVAKRFNITAREARDIATAVTTLGKAVVTPSSRYGSRTKNKGATIVKTVGDVAKQVGETYTAATKGKKGTTAIQLRTRMRSASGLPRDVEYKVGKERRKRK